MKPKILLGTPTFDGKAYCLEYWIRNVRAIQQYTPCDVLLVDNSPGDDFAQQIRSLGVEVLRSPAHEEPLKALGESRRVLFEQAKARGYSHLFSLEQDLFPPPDILDHLRSIRNGLEARQAVVAAPYLIKFLSSPTPPYDTVNMLTSVARGLVYSPQNKRDVQNLITALDLINEPGIGRYFAAGLGCALIDVSILQQIEVRYSQAAIQPDDALFYLDLDRLGIPLHVDTRLLDKVVHISGNVHTVHGWWSMASSVKFRRPEKTSRGPLLDRGGEARG